MSGVRADRQPTRGRRRGLSLVEAVVAMVIVGLTLVAALNTTGASRLAQRQMGDRARGKLLAQGLMPDILRQDYADPDGHAVFGSEADESSASRADFDDVDDYNGWSASPPQYKDGTKLPELTGWKRSVAVTYVSPDNLDTTVGLDLGVKRITVEVTYNGAAVASLTAVRTDVAGITFVTTDLTKHDPEGGMD